MQPFHSLIKSRFPTNSLRIEHGISLTEQGTVRSVTRKHASRAKRYCGAEAPIHNGMLCQLFVGDCSA